MIRWYKIWRDLWFDKTRTILVILSITIGVIGVGVIGQARYFLTMGMKNSFSASSPANITILGESFEPTLLPKIKKLAHVKRVQAQNTIYGKIKVLKGASEKQHWNSLKLFSISDFKEIEINKLYLEQGKWPVNHDEIALERTTMDYFDTRIGDEIAIQLPNGKEEKFRISGTVLDPIRETPGISGYAYAYTSLKTSISREIAANVNTVLIHASRAVKSKKQLEDLAIRVRDFLNSNHVSVFTIDLIEPNKHWAYDMVKSAGMILVVFGLLGLLLGTGLIVNTISAIMISQRRQIGVMKVMGASFTDIFLIYVRYVMILGFLALSLGIPISLWASKILIRKSVYLLNFDLEKLNPSVKVMALQMGVGLFIPIIVAVIPIIMHGRIPIVQAILGQSYQHLGRSSLESILQKVTLLPRPILLSLRNTFRRKARLLLTLVTLSIGGAMVLSVFSIKSSIHETVEKTLGYAHYDVQYSLPAFGEGKKIETVLGKIKGIKNMDTAFETFATMVRPDHSKTLELYVLGVNPLSDFIRPTMIKGSWLTRQGTNEIVVNQMMLRTEKNLKIGDDIKLNINGKDSSWKVAGFAAIPRRIDFFVDKDSLNQSDQINLLQVQIKNSARTNLSEAGLEIRKQLLSKGLMVEAPAIMKDLIAREESRNEIIIILLFGMAGLICLIAGIGLMGTMSLSVMERKLEIGIMRSIGATSPNLWSIFVAEAMVIGFMSGCIAAILAYPISKFLSNQIGETLFETPLFFVYPLSGIFYWLVIVMILSAIASFLPAWRASRVLIKEVLNYE